MTENNQKILSVINNGKKGETLPPLGPKTAQIYRRATGYEKLWPGELLVLGKKYPGKNGDFLREIMLGDHSFVVDERGTAIGPHGEEVSLPSNSPDSEVK